jgi:hypothetical protein
VKSNRRTEPMCSSGNSESLSASGQPFSSLLGPTLAFDTLVQLNEALSSFSGRAARQGLDEIVFARGGGSGVCIGSHI